MDNHKPSQFLRYLRRLAPDDFFRSIWSGRLPPNVRAVLAGQPEGDVTAAARCANCIVEAALPGRHGSSLYVYPRRLIPRHKECVNYHFCAVNGTTIPTYRWLPLVFRAEEHARVEAGSYLCESQEAT